MGYWWCWIRLTPFCLKTVTAGTGLCNKIINSTNKYEDSNRRNKIHVQTQISAYIYIHMQMIQNDKNKTQKDVGVVNDYK